MPSYQENYIYSVQVTGAAQAIAQLQQLQQLTNQVKSQNVGNIGGASGASASGAAAGDEWGRSFGSTVSRAITNTLVYGAIGVAVGGIIAGVSAWKEANVALSDSLAELQVKLGATRSEAEAYYWSMQQAAFATGQDVQESVYARTVEQRTSRTGLARGGMEFGMVFPEVPVQDAVGNLLALQIQFGTSFGEINEVLLDTVQASGLTAKELLNLSDTWGPLSQELGMLDAAGNRTTEGMRNISGLMAGMATVMGESGSTIENFLRKMSQFYTNDDLKAFLSLRGIETTAGKTAAGLDIRVPFMDLMAQISAQAKAESGFAVGLQEFFPNQLGQPTQQQLQELIRNWDTISGIMAKSTDPVKEWGNAVEASSQRASIAIERLGTAFSGFFAAISGNEAFVRMLNEIASGVENKAIRMAGGSSINERIDASQVAGQIRDWAPLKDALEGVIEEAIINGGGKTTRPGPMNIPLQNDYMGMIMKTVQVSSDYNFDQISNLLSQAIPKFLKSDSFKAEDTPDMMTQAFIGFISDMGQVVQDQMAGYARPTFTTTGTRDDISGVYELDSASWTASQSIYDMASAADTAFSILGGARVTIPEGATVGQVTAEYTRLMQENAAFMSSTGIPLVDKNGPAAFNPTMLVNDSGEPLDVMIVNEDVFDQAATNVDKQIKADDALNKKNQAASDAAANKANAQAEARAKRLEQLFDSMFSAITAPTSVTASDLMYNAPGGMYKDKWDEPVRQMRADVNNLINGKPNEYGYGGGAFSSIFTPGILGFAQGADQDTKAAIMKDLQAQAEKAYYSFTLPQDAYAGGKDALIASAQDWVAGKKNEKANKAMMKGWLTEAGLGPEAMGFLDEMDEPPIVKMLTGGKTKDEMTTIFQDKIPNVSDSLAKGAKDVAWLTIIGGVITTQAKEDPDPLIAAGQAMGGWLAKGSSAAFVTLIVPMIIAAVLDGL